jgi:hypothetical protein
VTAMTDQPTRTPYCTKIRYGITGAPILDCDEMDGSHAPGVGVAPKLVELVYSAPRDGKAAAVSASVTGGWTRFGRPGDGEIAVHFTSDPASWPAWLAAEARLHDPAVSSAGVVQLPPTNQAALRDRIAEALLDHLSRTADIRRDTEGELAFMPVVTDPERLRIADAVLKVLPAPVDRGAVLLEAAAGFDARAAALTEDLDDLAGFVAKARINGVAVWRDAAEELRRMAAEAPATEEQDVQPQPDETQTVVDAIVSALQERGGELSALAEEEMRPSLEERAQEWLAAAEMARRAGRKAAGRG